MSGQEHPAAKPSPRPWFVVEPPFNEGAPLINAETPDPHGGEFVCDLAWPHDTPEDVGRTEANAALIVQAVNTCEWLLAENEYLRVRMMVAVSFLDSETLDKFHEHVAEIDAKHREANRAAA